ncbi:MAG: hypothetical protein IJT79_04595 [Ruminococcus sp.]|nr:hypothetical protein [Ruminococcus sp.]
MSSTEDYIKIKKIQAEKNERNAARLRDEADKNRQRNERLINAKRRLLPELKKKLAEIDTIPYPKKPKFLYALFNKGDGARISIYIFFFLLILSIVLLFVYRPLFVVCVILTVVEGIYVIVTAVISHIQNLNEYYYITDDFDYYKEELKNQIRKQYNKKANNMAVHNSIEEPEFISNWS